MNKVNLTKPYQIMKQEMNKKSAFCFRNDIFFFTFQIFFFRNLVLLRF